MKWVKPPIETERVRALATSHNLDLLTASILTRREFTDPSRIAFFLEEDERFLHNPFLFSDMETAVERVLAAAEEGEKVLVCGDKDTDGITGTVLMVEALQLLGLDPEWRVPLGDEDFGLNPDVLKAKAAEDVTLVITVDCGITDFNEIELAANLGMDVLVFDHHMPRTDRLPDALAIVNPKVGDSYPFKGLCAVAVVSKFLWALCFAGTDMWNQSFCLIHAHRLPDGKGIVVEAARMMNLLERNRVVVSSSGGEADRDRLLRFIEGEPLLSYGISVQTALVSEFFGGAEVYLADSAKQLWQSFPSIRGRSLSELESHSRLARYFPENEGSLTTMRNLIITLHSRKNHEAFEPWRRTLDLVALGTLADLMPLEDENRIMVRLGLARINGGEGLKERRAALRELMVRQRLHEGRIGTTEVAWQLCPLVNASGRMGKADLGVRLFLENDPAVISRLGDELMDLNRQRRALGESLWDKIRPQAYLSRDAMGGPLVLIADEDIPRGITGILATRLQKTMDVAAVVVSLKGKVATGSIRCDSGMNALNWLESLAPILADFGGHPRAGGFRFPLDRLDEFTSRTRAWLAGKSPVAAERELLRVDAELSHAEITRLGIRGLDELLERLEPYGEGFRPLTFLTRSVKVLQADLVGKPKNNHLKLLVALGENKWPALWWDAADRYGADICPDAEVDLVYHVDRDRWRGAEARRLTVLEASPCRS